METLRGAEKAPFRFCADCTQDKARVCDYVQHCQRAAPNTYVCPACKQTASTAAGAVHYCPSFDPLASAAEGLDRVAQFDEAAAKVTQARGAVYGHPKVDFDRAARLKAVIDECEDPVARHAMHMICVKLARLIETPTHLDSWVDIAGYARTGVMATDQ